MNRATLASILCLAVLSACAAKGTTTTTSMKTSYDAAPSAEKSNARAEESPADARTNQSYAQGQNTNYRNASNQTGYVAEIKNDNLPDSEAAKTAPEAVSTFGGTAPSTEILWTYPDAPNPAFRGTPDYALTSIAFSQGSASLDNEAAGALRTGMMEESAGGDAEDVGSVKLLVVGFADAVTERSNADALGMRRAEATRDQLVRLGYSRDNIQVSSFGARYSEAKDWEVMKQQYERNAVVWVLK